MTWFEKLTGIEEKSPEHVREKLLVEGDQIVCPNGDRIAFGRLETPSLSDLRKSVANLNIPPKRSTITEVVGDVRKMHLDSANANALFQVASQFNLLEMTGPSVTPERGVGIYQFDNTQGPACAIACGAGTIYRNYFAKVDGQIGQSADKQIDCSADLGAVFGNDRRQLWTMQNGYLFPSRDGLAQINQKIQSLKDAERHVMLGHLRIGLQLNAQVTLPGADHRVSQAYCSALPVAYGNHPTDQWTGFAKLILDAAYEATLSAVVLNAAQTGNPAIFLTLLGGGVFGNRESWITGAIERAYQRHLNHGLDIRIVSYGQSHPNIAQLAHRLSSLSVP
jgi:hypothetical protein